MAVLVKVWPLAVDACDPVLRAESCAEERSAEWVESRGAVRAQAGDHVLFEGMFVVDRVRLEKLHSRYAVAAVIEAAVQQRQDDRGCPESMPIRFVRGLCGRAVDPGSYRSLWWCFRATQAAECSDRLTGGQLCWEQAPG